MRGRLLLVVATLVLAALAVGAAVTSTAGVVVLVVGLLAIAPVLRRDVDDPEGTP